MKSFLVDIAAKAFILFGFGIIWIILGIVNSDRTEGQTH